MITITVYSLSLPPSPMFRRVFDREMEAADYEAFMRRLGCCHLRRTK